METTIHSIPVPTATDDPVPITITAVGDIMLDRRLLPPRMFFHHPDFSSCGGQFEGQVRYPFQNTEESVRWLAELDRHVHGIRASSHMSQSIPLQLPEGGDSYDFPFRKIVGELLGSDIVFGNLECPLSTRGRRMNNDTCYRAHPGFAEAMATAGFGVLSLANNHSFDYGEVAFHDTLDALRQNGIAPVGAGASLAEARTPAIVNVKGVNVAFLAYSLLGPHWIWATHDESGVAPLNPLVVGQDVQRVRREADVVVVSMHWGVESRAVPYPRIVELAHDCIDNGADVILGHHPHVPGSVEIYRDRPIFYSLGNFIFGHDHDDWGDGMMARIHLDGSELSRVEIIPVTGRYQPAVATGDAAAAVRKQIADASRRFQTSFTLAGGIEMIQLAR